MRPLAIGALLVTFGVSAASAQVTSCGDAGAAPCAVEVQRRALVIGVSKYPRLEASKQLRFADADARAFAGFLTAADGPHLNGANVRLLVNDSATVPLILRELRGLLRESRAGDVAIVYFAGHGTEEDGEAPRRAFLLASDAARQSELDVGGIEFSQLQSWLEKFVQKNVRVILVTDACRSGGMAVNEGYTRGAATALQRRFNGVTQLLSSDGDELSMESEQWGSPRLGKGHGVYTYYLLEGWRGLAADTATGIVTLRNLQDFVRDQVRKATGDKQSPQHTGSLRDTVLTLAPQAVAAMRREATSGSGAAPASVVASANGTATRDAGAPSGRSLDPTSRALVRAMRDAIVAGRLTPPATGSALSAYRTLSQRSEARGVLPGLVDELVAAMQQDADLLIHRYLEGGNDQPRAAAYRDAGELLSTALSLLPVNDPGRPSLMARRDFLLGYAIVRGNERARFPEGEARLRRAIALEPRAAYAWNALGLLRSAIGDQRQAERFFQSAIAKAPRWQYPVNNLAVVYQERRDYTRAIATFRTAIALDTLGAAAYNNLGIVYASLGRYATARRWYQRAITAQPDLHMARNNLASLYRATGRRALAHVYLDSAFALVQRDTRGGDSLSTLLESGRLQMDQLDVTSADSTFARAARAAPGRPEPLFYRGEAQRSLGDRRAAERFYRLSIARDPRYAPAYNGLSLLYRSRPESNYPRARAVLGEAERRLPGSPELSYFRGWLEQDQMLDTAAATTARDRAFVQAVASFQETLKRDPLYGSAYTSLAEVYETRDRWSDAEAWYRRGVTVADSSADVRYAFAEHYARRAQRDTAHREQWLARQREELRALIAIDSEYVPALYALALNEMDAGEMREATRLLQASASLGFASAMRGAPARALQLRGATLEREGKLEIAGRAYAGAMQLDPSLVDAAFGRARVLYLLGTTRPALALADSILPAMRDDDERRAHALLLAHIYLDLGEHGRALDAATRALPRDTTFAAPELLLLRALAQNAIAAGAAGAADAALRDRATRAVASDLTAFRHRVRSPEEEGRVIATFSAAGATQARALLARGDAGR